MNFKNTLCTVIVCALATARVQAMSADEVLKKLEERYIFEGRVEGNVIDRLKSELKNDIEFLEAIDRVSPSTRLQYLRDISEPVAMGIALKIPTVSIEDASGRRNVSLADVQAKIEQLIRRYEPRG